MIIDMTAQDYLPDPTDSEGWEIEYEEWLAECANPDRALEEMCDEYENGTPEDRYLIQFEMHLLSGDR
jgi:hypothetical protein